MKNKRVYPNQSSELSMIAYQTEGGLMEKFLEEGRPLRVACVTMGMMGLFMPTFNCAAALREKGHEVYIITNGSEGMRRRATPMAESIGAKMAYTNCGLDVDKDLLKQPESRFKHPLDPFLKAWHPHVLEQIESIRPDVMLCDQRSACG